MYLAYRYEYSWKSTFIRDTFGAPVVIPTDGPN